MRRAPASFISACVVAALACVPAPAQVVLRAGAGTIEGRIKQVSVEGVLVAVGSGESAGDQRLIGWDRVKAVEGEAASKAAAFEDLSTKAWRARTRAERGDWVAAEPLFEELFKQTEEKDGPTAAMVAEGLLRCRLRRGAQGAALWPWLEWLGVMERSGGLGPAAGKARAAWVGGSIDAGSSGLPRAFDEQTGLALALPPVWLGGTSAAVVASAPEWEKFRTRPGMVGELAGLYEQAARFEAGLPAAIPASAGESAGVHFVRDLVLAQAGDDEQRKNARAALKLRVSPPPVGSGLNKKAAPPPPRWTEAWCRVAIGRSLLREAEESSRLRAVIELLHLPARFSADEPYLAGVALAQAGEALAQLGDSAGAAALRSDMAARFPRHPALDLMRSTGTPGHSSPDVPAGAPRAHPGG